MKTTERKGVTKVVMIALVAAVVILAGVLIFTFVTMNNQVKLAAEYQEKASQQIAELTEKLDSINNITADEISAEMIEQIQAHHAADSAQLTEEQVKAIVTEAMKTAGESLTENQVAAIVNEAINGIDTGLTEAEAKKIVTEALKGVNTGVTEAQVKAIVEAAMKTIQSPLTEDQIRQIIQEELSRNQ